MSEHIIEVPVVAIPEQVQLEENVLYLYRDGKLHQCGHVNCILGHASQGTKYLQRDDLDIGLAALSFVNIREHFDGSWSDYGPDSPGSAHVIRTADVTP